MDIPSYIRRLRVFSWSVGVFSCIKLSEALDWAFKQDLSTLTPEAVALVTAILTALVGLLKFTYTFATSKSDDK